MIKIPVLDTIAAAYRFVFEQLGAIIGLIWIPQLIASVAEYLSSRPFAVRIMAGDTAEVAASERLLAMAGQAVSFLLFAVIAVAVTRQALGLRKGPARAYFSFGMPELRVFGGMAAMACVGALFLFVAVLAGGMLGAIPGPAGGLAASAGMLILVGAVIYAMTRLTFLLVPASVTHEDYGIERSWTLTAGSFWRILAVILATVGPVFLIFIIAFAASVGPDYFPKDLGMLQDQETMRQFQEQQTRAIVRSQPMMQALAFALAPFTYGLTLGAAAGIFKFLSSNRPAPATGTQA